MERRKRRRRGGVFEVGKAGEDGRGFKKAGEVLWRLLGKGGIGV